jgi:2-methylcitrate dehydratase PrpD
MPDHIVTRRRALATLASSVAATVTLRDRAFAAAPGPVMLALSEFMAGATTRALPDDVLEHTRLHVLDTFAAMISGTQLAPGEAALRFARAQRGTGRATVVGSSLTAGAVEAALANGVLAHSDETDDSHGPSQSHPGAPIVAATLAAGEEYGVSGDRFLRAVALGYDVGPRVTMAMGGVDFRNESHQSTHAIAGAFGAAAAAGSVAGLSAQQMRWLLDYTAQQSSGIASWARDPDHILKGFVFGGMPARSGVTAAILVKLGWTGIDDVFSGDDNFFAAHAPKARPQVIVDALGTRYEVTQTDIKKWTVGTPIQGPLDALVNIRGKRRFEADDVKGVVVRLAPTVAAVVDNRELPDISLQHMMAVMLVDKTATFKAVHDAARMKDATILRHRAKVQLVKDDSLAQLLPARVTIVEITLNDGTRLVERVDAVRGTVRNPMTRQEVVEKARDLIAPVLGTGQSAKLIEATLSLEGLPSVRDLRSLLQRA